MQDEYAAAAPVHKKRPKPVEGEAPAAAGEAPEAKRPKADAAGDAAGEKPPRKKPGPKPGFKRKPKVDGGAPAVQGDAAGSESAPASQADAPASPPRHKPAVAHAEATATPEAPAGKGAAKVPLQLRVIVEALNVRFLVRVSKSLTVHTVRNRIEAQYARLYPEIASQCVSSPLPPGGGPPMSGVLTRRAPRRLRAARIATAARWRCTSCWTASGSSWTTATRSAPWCRTAAWCTCRRSRATRRRSPHA